MKFSVVMLVFLFFDCAIGQSVTEIERTYGRPINSYVVSKSIWMTPEFTEKGRICRIRFHPMRFSSGQNNLMRYLSLDEINSALDDIVPLNSRGTAREPFGLTTTGGGTIWTTYAYDNVTVAFVGSLDSNIKASKASEPYTFSDTVAAEGAMVTERSHKRLLDFNLFKPEIVIVSWNDTKCVAQ